MWWVNSDNIIWILGLKLATTGDYVNTIGGGSFQGQLTDSNDANVGNAFNFSYLANSDGEWYGILIDNPGGSVLTVGDMYTLTVTIIDASANKLVIKIKREASFKGF